MRAAPFCSPIERQRRGHCNHASFAQFCVWRSHPRSNWITVRARPGWFILGRIALHLWYVKHHDRTLLPIVFQLLRAKSVKSRTPLIITKYATNQKWIRENMQKPLKYAWKICQNQHHWHKTHKSDTIWSIECHRDYDRVKTRFLRLSLKMEKR